MFRDPDNLHRLQGRFRPKGCFSTSCTQFIEQSLDVELNAHQSAIRVNTNFVLADPNGPDPRLCTADCGGADYVYFSIEDAITGTYSVWLGETELGELDIPIDPLPDQEICFGELW